MEVADLLAKMITHKASDLYLTVGSRPLWRANDMIMGTDELVSEEDIKSMLAAIASLDDLQKFEKEKELNIAYVDKDGNRFRVNCFKQRQQSGMVIRHIKSNVPSIEALNLPDAYKKAIMLKNGLILVSGPAGSGKSTSIASMLDYLNAKSSGHVITIEDPIEYIHQHKGCIFTQREVGLDTNSWDDALKNALRQRPDVIYIGEIRDAQTMLHALNYAETGHLCIATVHATSAAQTIERVGHFFASSVRQQYLYSLSHTLKYVFAQRLVNGAAGKVLAIEVLKNEGLIKPLIAKAQIAEINELMYKNADIGMQTFEQSLLKLYDAGLISRATAIDEAENQQNMELELLKRVNNQKPNPNKISIDF